MHTRLLVHPRFRSGFTGPRGGTGIENRRAILEPDGSAYVVIADKDPGIGGNWVDAFQHRHGTMSLRFIKCETPPSVRAYLVPLADLEKSGRQALAEVNSIDSGEQVD